MQSSGSLGGGKIARITATKREAATVSGLGMTTITKLIREKRLSAVKVGRRTLIRWDSLEQLLAPSE